MCSVVCIVVVCVCVSVCDNAFLGSFYQVEDYMTNSWDDIWMVVQNLITKEPAGVSAAPEPYFGGGVIFRGLSLHALCASVMLSVRGSGSHVVLHRCDPDNLCDGH